MNTFMSMLMYRFAALLSSGDVDIPQTTADTTTVDVAINIITAIAAGIAVFMVVFGGFKLVVSSGDPQAVGTSTRLIIYALVGLVIIIAARVIVGFVLGRV